MKKKERRYSMKLRAPAIPLITVDPYFSVWSCDAIHDSIPFHWTGSPNTLVGTVSVDGETFRFLGLTDAPAIPQNDVQIDALTTRVTYENDKIRLTAAFTSPLLIRELYYASRPVSYLALTWESLDGKDHAVSAKLTCSEELVLDKRGQSPVVCQPVELPGASCIRMGNSVQNPLNKAGDDIRIDWGYLYLAAKNGFCAAEKLEGMDSVSIELPLDPTGLIALAYDDIHSLIYFNQEVDAYWKKDGKTIESAITEALDEYNTLKVKCDAFAAELRSEALEKGGEEYAELLELAYRQVMAAHKLAVDPEGNILFISKECFSNGCAATVDVTYPSAPMFLRYNTELLKGMLRPVCKYSRTNAWEYDFAPHDVGTYPILNGQTYCENKLESQMPIEECGNMITLMAAICEADGNCEFAAPHMDLLEIWKKYLVEYGKDPGNQLCTDDFAGHLAHNVNLSIKAIMGIAGYAKILKGLGREAEARQHMQIARDYAKSVCGRSVNPDGSYRLAFDREGTFSLKYNAVWDKLWNTGLFPEEFYAGEMKRYHVQALECGIPLDSRETYTKSDWIHWICCMGSPEDFAAFTHLLWNAYNQMDKRVPMCDWYFADTGAYKGFHHRSVQGGLFMRFLFD